MSSLKSTVDKLKNLEAEKLSLLAEVEELKRIAEAKSNALANEIGSLREEINSLKNLIGAEKPQVQSSGSSLREKNLIYIKDLADKTLNESKQLGSQVFSTSPFSENYDNWLGNLHEIVSNFESSSPINVDEQFVKERSQILQEIEGTLSKKKVEEASINSVAKVVAENNHLLMNIDKEYAEKTKELSAKKDSELLRLSNRVRELEVQVKSQDEDNSKRKILKKKTDDKTPQTRQDLKSAKNELEAAQQNFASAKQNLDSEYEIKKQTIMGQIEGSREELEKLETDISIEARQGACKALADSVNALVQRTTSIA